MKCLPIVLLAALLSSCASHVIPPNIPIESATSSHQIAAKASTYKLLYDFGSSGFNDAIQPKSALTFAKGVLYGTSSSGGVYRQSTPGTVFTITPRGVEHVIHSFGSTTDDGSAPEAPLVALKGTLYGTTSIDSVSGQGAVFEISSTGKERVIYHFGTHANDGFAPAAGLVAIGNVLYGTTTLGGTYDAGTVFSITPQGTERVLHSFGKTNDGRSPRTGLVVVHGVLYGTTSEGGGYTTGTVFRVVPGSGAETVLHNFSALYTPHSDGATPLTTLVADGTTLFGTTNGGGGANSEGTVYSISTKGKEHVIYTFGAADSSDGSNPEGDLVILNGMLYGTTTNGGGYSTGGTIFRVDPKSGAEVILHSFGNGHDESGPEGGLANAGGTLYGTTTYGGTYSSPYGADGTAFAIKP